MKQPAAIALLYVLSVSGAMAVTVYKTVDENGNIVFSDKPSSNSQEIQVKEPTTFKNTNPKLLNLIDRQEQASVQYEAQILMPQPSSVVIDSLGNVDVSIAITPTLQPTHKAQLKVDGDLVSGSPPMYHLTDIERGDHTLILEIIDDKGEPITVSEPTVFTLKRHFKQP